MAELSRDDRIQQLIDESDIHSVLVQYCHGVDRKRFDLVRACYHPDATDDHGVFTGGIDAFIDYMTLGLQGYERTMHVLSNVRIEVDGDHARAESYAIAFHRVAARGSKPDRDHVVAFRFLDDFERRDGRWAIAQRVLAFEWTRTDPVPAGWDFGDEFLRGQAWPDDRVFAPRGELIR